MDPYSNNRERTDRLFVYISLLGTTVLGRAILTRVQ